MSEMEFGPDCECSGLDLQDDKREMSWIRTTEVVVVLTSGGPGSEVRADQKEKEREKEELGFGHCAIVTVGESHSPRRDEWSIARPGKRRRAFDVALASSCKSYALLNRVRPGQGPVQHRTVRMQQVSMPPNLLASQSSRWTRDLLY
jgi:hypothetical protein